MQTQLEKLNTKIEFLHNSQAFVWECIVRFIVLVAGRRWGKTTLAIRKIVEKTNKRDIQNVKVWYVGPTYKQAKMIAWKMLIKELPPLNIMSKNEVDLSIKLKNGSQISLKGADNEDSLRGVGLDYVVLDEYSSMKPHIWEEIIRPMLIDSGGGALFIGTPKGKNHFYKMYLREKEDDDYKSFHFTSYDNPLIEKSEIDKAKKESGETYFKQEYLASFEDYIGLVWPEFNQKFHVIPQIQIDKQWKRYRLWDMATSGVVVCLWMAVDMSDNLIFYCEYYDKGKAPSLHAEAVNRLNGDDRVLIDYSCHYAFTSTQADRMTGKLHTLADEYRKDGITLNPAVNAKDEGVARVSELMIIDKEIPHPFYSGLQGSPKIFFTKNCTHTIEQVENYRRITKESDTEHRVKYVDIDMHCCDCVRYGAMSRPEAAKRKPKITYDEFGRPNLQVYMDAAIEERELEEARY